MTELPLVSIAAICYNHSRFLIEALDSIKNQTYANIELIIVDDCSTDNSVNLIKEWLKDYRKPFKLILHPKNEGSYIAHNEAVDNAKGKYFAFLATDDAIMSYKIAEQVSLMEMAKTEVGLVYGDCMMVDEKGNILHNSLLELHRGEGFFPPSGKIFTEILKGFYFYSQASLIHLELLKKVKYEFKKDVISEDWDLELTLSRNYDIVGNTKVYTKYRKLDSSITSANWSADNYSKVFKSQFAMVEKYYNHPLNSIAENKLVLKRLREIYNALLNCKNFTFKEKLFYGFKIFKITKSIRDLLML